MVWISERDKKRSLGLLIGSCSCIPTVDVEAMGTSCFRRLNHSFLFSCLASGAGGKSVGQIGASFVLNMTNAESSGSISIRRLAGISLGGGIDDIGAGTKGIELCEVGTVLIAS